LSSVISPAGTSSIVDLPAPAGGHATTARTSGSTPAAATPLPDLREQTRAAAQQLQEYLRKNGHHMQFSVDKASGMTIVRIYNDATGELVRQIPSEEIVHIAEILRQEDGRSTLSIKA
jgi:flagellar protein FlaG